MAANLFYFTSGAQPLVLEPNQISEFIHSLLLATTVYFLINSWLTAFAISFEKSLNPFPVWRENFLWLSLNYFGGASLAALLVAYTRDISFVYLVVIIPLLLVIYLTFKTSMARVEDAKQHLDQMNDLYLSTIETLAMAIDAKDQVTHGHIRRVQIYACGLAKVMGMNSESETGAVKAAALLHDMGKLAIPEHILNKPGKLTPAEFEKMKRHASIGAEILSTIDFPYPVVPIVRHHHENWDGNGYPDGLAGTQIPLGARILSVVDCFDALTSDRPYRPELPVSEAIEILRERSGTMYDPDVVETFVRVHKSIAPTERDLASRKAIGAIIAAELEEPTQEKASTTQKPGLDDLPLVADLGADLRATSTLEQAGNCVAEHLRARIGFSLCVHYIYEQEQDELVARQASGLDSDKVIGLRIQIGNRLTGWVASNRKTIHNSDPVLDFADEIDRFRPILRSCLSTPLILDGDLIGVITLYATKEGVYPGFPKTFGLMQ